MSRLASRQRTPQTVFWPCRLAVKSRSLVHAATGCTPHCLTISAAGSRPGTPSKSGCNTAELNRVRKAAEHRRTPKRRRFCRPQDCGHVLGCPGAFIRTDLHAVTNTSTARGCGACYDRRSPLDKLHESAHPRSSVHARVGCTPPYLTTCAAGFTPGTLSQSGCNSSCRASVSDAFNTTNKSRLTHAPLQLASQADLQPPTIAVREIT